MNKSMVENSHAKENLYLVIWLVALITSIIHCIVLSAIDQRQGQVAANLPGGEDYSKLGLCDNDVENNYQLLDKKDLGSKVKK